MNMQTRNRKLSLYATPPHDCGYLPAREATTVFVDPMTAKNKRLYTMLSRQGFRRSGEHLYRPHCSACNACVPVRVPVASFKFNRAQRRIWKRNREVDVQRMPPVFSQEHFQLYRRYIHERHPDGGMENPNPRSYMQFLTCSWADTWFYEFRFKGKLIAVAVADSFLDGLSAVYTFFDPECEKSSPGAFAVLWEIHEARRLEMEYLYLGYFIEGCRKMNYKKDFRPIEAYTGGEWQLL